MPKTRAYLDLESSKLNVDNISDKDYSNYCDKLWYSEEEVIKIKQRCEDTRLIRDRMINRIRDALDIKSLKLEDIEKEIISKYKK